ncbi:hypothetical protein [Deinococcus hohokamensis]|uniref:Uncharacterized protein n=1 Tax=Deinococcus hohokamensis TaxID=309883 RepID=A0ABV9I6L8_9DEIO
MNRPGKARLCAALRVCVLGVPALSASATSLPVWLPALGQTAQLTRQGLTLPDGVRLNVAGSWGFDVQGIGEALGDGPRVRLGRTPDPKQVALTLEVLDRAGRITATRRFPSRPAGVRSAAPCAAPA